MTDKTAPSRTGTVVSVRGSVVDVRFDTQLPPIHSLLRTGDEGGIVINACVALPCLPPRDWRGAPW